MENIAKSLENKQILVVNAITRVNTKSKKSRFINQIIKFDKIIYQNEFGAFFNPFEYENSKWRLYYNLNNDTIEIDKIGNMKSKSIIVNEFLILK